jgi:hypothetical protein
MKPVSFREVALGGRTEVLIFNTKAMAKYPMGEPKAPFSEAYVAPG